MSSLLDSITSAIFLFVFAIAALVSLMIFTSLSGSGMLGSYATAFNGFYDAMNNVALFVAIGMALAAVFAGLMIRTHPAFFIIAVVLVFIQFLILPPLVNSYNTLMQTQSLAIQNQYANMIAIMQILPVLSAVGTCLAILVGLLRE